MSRIRLATLTITALFAAVVVAQQPPAAPIKRTPLQTVDVVGSPYQTVTGIAEIAANVNIGRHTHPGYETGYVMDLAILQKIVEERLIRHLDHKNLNVDVPWFKDLNPTAENIAIVAWRQICPAIPAGLRLRLRLWETPRNYVEYEGA